VNELHITTAEGETDYDKEESDMQTMMGVLKVHIPGCTSPYRTD
jgi:hypothetical protein